MSLFIYVDHKADRDYFDPPIIYFFSKLLLIFVCCFMAVICSLGFLQYQDDMAPTSHVLDIAILTRVGNLFTVM